MTWVSIKSLVVANIPFRNFICGGSKTESGGHFLRGENTSFVIL